MFLSLVIFSTYSFLHFFLLNFLKNGFQYTFAWVAPWLLNQILTHHDTLRIHKSFFYCYLVYCKFRTTNQTQSFGFCRCENFMNIWLHGVCCLVLLARSWCPVRTMWPRSKQMFRILKSGFRTAKSNQIILSRITRKNDHFIRCRSCVLRWYSWLGF